MSKISVKLFEEKAGELYARYGFGFAGRSRATRDLGELDSIIGELEALITEARSSDDMRNTPAFVGVLETAINNLNTYKSERVEIEKAQSNPVAVAVAPIAEKVGLHAGIYARHFAGKNRATRDLLLLEELIETFKNLEFEMLEALKSVGADSAEELNDLRSDLELFQNELSAIKESRKDGSVADKISMYAQLANNQFRLYNVHFAGKSRGSRRAELLERMIKNLTEYRKEMRSIQENPTVTDHVNTTNIQVVTGNLEVYEEELKNIRSLQQSMSPSELASQLADAANQLMKQYGDHFAGQARATRDVQLLSDICDGMRDVSLLMETLLGNTELQFNTENYDKVNTNWKTYENEYLAVREVAPQPSEDV